MKPVPGPCIPHVDAYAHGEFVALGMCHSYGLTGGGCRVESMAVVMERDTTMVVAVAMAWIACPL